VTPDLTFRVWIVGDSAEDADEFHGYRDAEEAAEAFAHNRAHNRAHDVDCADGFIDGEPVQVFVADEAGKVIGCYEVAAESDVRIRCEEVDIEGGDA